MNDSDALGVLMLTAIVAILAFLNLVVWFSYDSYKKWIINVRSLTRRYGIPILVFPQFVREPWYKWITRSFLLAMFALGVIGLALILSVYISPGN